MKNREPFKLKEFILAYNIIQVVACLYVINEVSFVEGCFGFTFEINIVLADMESSVMELI